jgi:hypothetical protein
MKSYIDGFKLNEYIYFLSIMHLFLFFNLRVQENRNEPVV